MTRFRVECLNNLGHWVTTPTPGSFQLLFSQVENARTHISGPAISFYCNKYKGWRLRDLKTDKLIEYAGEMWTTPKVNTKLRAEVD